MKTWLKGGIIGVGILILQVIVSLVCTGIMIPSCGECAMMCMLPLMPNMIFHEWLNLLGISLIITEVALYFIVGAIIGLIVQKIKSKK